MVSLGEIIDRGNLSELVNSETDQVAIINLANALKVKITVPNNVFEWYVDIYNRNGELLKSNWYDHYGDKKENLVIEMRNSIAEFIHDITTKNSRIITKQNSSTNTFQIMKDNKWIDYI